MDHSVRKLMHAIYGRYFCQRYRNTTPYCTADLLEDRLSGYSLRPTPSHYLCLVQTKVLGIFE